MALNDVTLDEYQAACDDYMGWCPFCCNFTRDCTEPDAEDYDCPECGQNCVMGAEQAVIMGEINIVE